MSSVSETEKKTLFPALGNLAGYSLRFQFFAGFILSLLILIVAITWIVLGQVRPMLIEKNVELVEETGSGIVLDLGRSVLMAETITHSLTEVAATLENDPAQFEAIIPKILNMPGTEGLIAGGGIWPEPYLFNGERERRAFFWGRDANGVLQYYDDYNNPAGKGYHNEEWYVPASLIARKGCFWSLSYMDPHTREPMVTCTMRYDRAGEFAGVATVDIRLSGLAEFFAEAVSKTGGYAFAVDRNNRILSFPDWTMAARRTDEFGSLDFLPFSEVAGNFPSFAPVAEALTDINQSVIGRVIAEPASPELITWMDEKSEQINYQEAQLIAAFYPADDSTPSMENAAVRRVAIENDYFLADDATASVFEVPGAFWKVVIVTPSSSVVTAAQKTAFAMMVKFFIVALAAMMVWYLMISNAVLKPIQQMASRLRHSRTFEEDAIAQDALGRRDELGDLFRAIADRSRQVIAQRQELRKEIEIRRQAEEAANMARREAEKACRLQSEFIANMSHEIRTPLNGILGMAQLLSASGKTGKQREYANIILSSGNSLLSIINDVLDISKVEAGLLEIEKEAFDLEGLVNQAVEAVTGMAMQKQLSVEAEIEPGAEGCYIGDARRIKQVLINLIGNAVKFTDHGTITLSARPWSDRIQFEVSDTGPGIPAEEQATIFERFRQADGSGTRRHGGTGLGLAICRELVAAMGGSIDVESEPGHGSRFHFELPLERTAVLVSVIAANEEHTPEPSRAHSGPCDILLVEDNLINRMVVTAALQDSDVNLSTAGNGLEALEMMENYSFDLVLMDVQMPVMPGDEAVQLIRAAGRPWSDTPIIMLTANAMIGDREKYLALGANGYLTKPLDFEQLFEMIERFRHGVPQASMAK